MSTGSRLRVAVARTDTGRREVPPAAYDHVRLVVIRDGSTILQGECGSRPITVGDAALVAPRVVFGHTPEGVATATTLMLDTDYLIEHLFWQHLDLIPDRDAARDLAAKLYPEPMQVLHLGEGEAGRLGPILDELVTRTETGQDAAGYFRAQALLSTVLEAITPHIPSAARGAAARVQAAGRARRRFALGEVPPDSPRGGAGRRAHAR